MSIKEANTKTVYIGDNGCLNIIKRVTGNLTDCIRASFKSDTFSANFTYDIKNDELVIHGWEKLSMGQIDFLEDKVKSRIKRMVAENEA